MSTKKAQLIANLLNVIVVAAMFFGPLTQMPVQAYTDTDAQDYTPGSSVLVYGNNSDGAGYLPGETVRVTVTQPVLPDPLVCEGVADANGAWQCALQLSSDPALAVGLYEYTTLGLTSGFTESHSFSDASVTVNLDQFANLPGQGWQNGNLNGSNSAYYEGTVIPFRFKINGLSGGTHTIHLNYAFTASGSETYDFLTAYDITESPDVCSNTATTSSPLCPVGTPATLAFPSDSNQPLGLTAAGLTVDGAIAYSGITDRYISMWGGTPISLGAVTYSGTFSGNSDADMLLTFDTGTCTSNCSVLFAWGGHLAQSAYWKTTSGGPNGAGQVSGSSFHMRTENLDNGGGAKQDRSMQSGAIVTTLTLVKVLDPTTDAGLFNLLIDGSTKAANVGNLGTSGPVSVSAGTHTVSETGGTGTDLANYQSSISCVDPQGGVVSSGTGNSLSVSIIAGINITCTFTNLRLIPEMTVKKSSTTTTLTAPGSIPYSYLVTNTGNVALTGISLSDNNDNNDMSCPATTLAVGDDMTCTATHTFTQAELDAGGSVDNTVTAISNEAPDATDDLSIPITQSAALSLVKTATPATYAAVGDVISYSYEVKNTGNVTLAGPVTVADDKATVTCPAGGLAPGASMTCTASFTITQAELDSGSVTNTAKASANGTDSNEDSETVDAVQSPALSLVKTATPATYDAVGEVISYSYKVTNTGNVTLFDISVVDDKATVTCPDTSTGLAPLGEITCTASYTISQADLDAGLVTNTAYATDGTTQSEPDSETVDAVQSPALSLVKTATPATYAAVGDVISYSYEVKNTGNVTLAGPVTVADDKATVTCPAGGLAPEASMTCTASYTITQTDLDFGSVTNTAKASANGTDSNEDSQTVTAVQSPALSLVKTATPATYAAVGDVISYSYEVKNTGNVTLAGPVTVADDKATVTCPAGGLAPEASMTCTASYTITQADLDFGSVTNTAKASANGTDSNEDSEKVTAVQSPALSLVKMATPATYAAVGDVISYSYEVKNTGNVTLAGPVTVSDDKATVTCPAGGLAPETSMTCTASYTITQADLDFGSVTNVAMAHANGTDSNQDDETVTAVQNPALSLVKTATPATYDTVGQTISYSYVVKNTGNVTLAGPVTVADDKATVTCPAGGLAPGASMTCTASYTITQADLDFGSVTNVAMAHANGTDSNQDDETVTADQKPALTIVKTATPATYAAVGDVISYSYKVTNTGNVTLFNISVADDKATVTCPDTSTGLAPLGEIICTASYTITQADLDFGSVTNTAYATDGTTQSEPDSETVDAVQSPALSLVKTATPATYDAVGEVISYSYKVTNTGNVTLFDISVVDDKATVTCPDTSTGLAPLGEITCMASYTITQADLDSGSVTNTAYATDGTTQSEPDSEKVTAIQSPELLLVKIVTSNGPYDTVGEAIDYGLVATNTGNVTLHNVSISDPKLGTLSCAPAQPATLAPQSSLSCTASHLVTQADLDAGSYYNEATAGSDETEPVTDDVTVPMTQNPALALDKSVTSAGPYDSVGDVIEYLLVATNTGNVTLHNVSISDPKLGTLTCTQPVDLAPAAILSCTGSHMVTQTDLDAGSYYNIATADSDETAPETDDATVPMTQKPALSLVKTATPATYAAVGDVISYSYEVKNTGNVTLAGPVTVADDKATVTCPAGGLAPGASMTCTASYTITQTDLDFGSVTNTAKGSANGTDSNQDDEKVTAEQKPAVTIDKLTNGADGLSILVGNALSWTYEVTNTGNVTLSEVSVTDSKGVTVTCAKATLAPAELMTCTASGTAAAGEYENIGSVSGKSPAGSNVTNSDTSSYFGADPQIKIVKVTNGSDGPTIIAGTDVTWSYTLTNVGNVPLSNVTVSDNQGVTLTYVSGDTNADGILDLTETWIFEATGTAIVGDYSNIGSASGSYTDSEMNSRTDTASDASSYNGRAEVNVNKSVNQAPFSGPQLTFQLREGAAPVTGQFGVILETQYANVENNGQVTFSTLLDVGKYALCEIVPEGYVPSYILGTYGVDWYKPGYAPGQGGLDPNITVCVDFTVGADGTIDFQNGNQIVLPGESISIDNQVGQMPLTIGFWKNHASAKNSNGGQDPVLDQMLYEATQAGFTIQIGTLLLPGGSTPDNAGTSATYAVNLLNKSTITTGKKMASDPCFNLAAQLLGYRLNAAFGAWPNSVAVAAADYAQAMLLAEHFNGIKHDPLSKKAIANLNYLAAVLDSFNNDTLVITTLTLPYPGVYK